MTSPPTERRGTASSAVAPENTAVRTALWRALHVEDDAPPHVLDDRVGLALAAPPPDWKSRGDMSAFTAPFRASILARARFIEDLVSERAHAAQPGAVMQYVILGAGLDSFAQRRTDLTSSPSSSSTRAAVEVYEVDQPGPQAWKRQRLDELGYGVPPHLHLVPVDFEAGDDWWTQVVAAGFDAKRPAIVASTGVSMYLTKEATAATLRQASSSLSPGSSFVMSFMLPIDMCDPAARPGVEAAARGAAASGTPFISFYTHYDMLELAHACGFKNAAHVSADALAARYFAGRADGLRPPSNSEELLVASV